MSTLKRGYWLLFMLVALSISVAAQDSEERQADCSPVTEQQPCDVDSSGRMLPSALQDLNRNIVYGATITEGYISARDTAVVSNPEVTRTTSSWLRETYTAFRPFIALNLYRGKTRFTLQSAPIMTYVPPRVASFSINGFIDPTVGFSLELSPRLLLNLAGAVSYGDQLSQVLVLTPANSTQGSLNRSGSVDAISASANSSAHAFTSAQFAVSGQVGLVWQRTKSQEFSLQVGRVYSTVPGESALPSRSPATNVSMARGQIGELLTPTLDLFGYSQAHQIESGTYSCTVTGGGLGFQKQYGPLTTLSGEAGPEYGSPGCNSRLGVSYSFGFQHVLSRISVFNVAATRGVDTFYAPGNTWVTSINGGIGQTISSNTSFDVNGGYLQGSHSFNSEARYSGFFFTPRFLWRITDSSSLSTQYGHLSSARGSASSIARDWISLGLLWHPKPKSF